MLKRAQARFETIAEARRRVADIAGIAANWAAIAHFEVIRIQTERDEPSANLSVGCNALTAHFFRGGGARLLRRERKNRAHGVQRERNIVRAQTGNLGIARFGVASARVQIGVVRGTLPGVVLEQIPDVFRTGHCSCPPLVSFKDARQPFACLEKYSLKMERLSSRSTPAVTCGCQKEWSNTI